MSDLETMTASMQRYRRESRECEANFRLLALDYQRQQRLIASYERYQSGVEDILGISREYIRPQWIGSE